MSRRSWLAMLSPIALVLVAGCADVPVVDDADPGPPDPTAPTTPAGPVVDFCETIDLADATEVAGAYGIAARHGFEGRPVRLTHRRVVNAGTDVLAEWCQYGTTLEQRALWLEAYEQRTYETIPGGAEPRDELGSGAFFKDSDDGWYTLSAPAAEATLSLTAIFSQTIDPAEAEEALTQLLVPALAQVPSGARLAGLVADHECLLVEEAVTRALDAPPDYSRRTELDASFSCEFSSSDSRRSASVSRFRGAADEWNIGAEYGWEPLDGVDDGWISGSGVIATRDGDDVLRVHMLGIGQDAPTVDQDLAREVFPILMGG